MFNDVINLELSGFCLGGVIIIVIKDIIVQRAMNRPFDHPWIGKTIPWNYIKEYNWQKQSTHSPRTIIKCDRITWKQFLDKFPRKHLTFCLQYQPTDKLTFPELFNVHIDG